MFIVQLFKSNKSLLAKEVVKCHSWQKVQSFMPIGYGHVHVTPGDGVIRIAVFDIWEK